MSPSRPSPLPFLLALLTPLLALAQEVPRRESGPLSWFWMAAIGGLVLVWLFLTLRKRRGPPPIDPMLRGPRSSSR